MEQHEAVIAQLERMAELARQMESIPALILETGYSYQAFGSWWFEFKKGGWRYRLAFDGRENIMTLDFGGRVTGGELPKWQTLTWRQAARDTAVEEVVELVRSAAPNVGPAA